MEATIFTRLTLHSATVFSQSLCLHAMEGANGTIALNNMALRYETLLLLTIVKRCPF